MGASSYGGWSGLENVYRAPANIKAVEVERSETKDAVKIEVPNIVIQHIIKEQKERLIDLD